VRLLIACFNFTNLSIGRTSQRFKEIAIRKVMGAQKKQIAKQFLFDSFLHCLLAFLVGIIAGIYPALFLSSFRPSAVLKRYEGPANKSAFLRKVLVVAQFTASIALMISTFIIFRQTAFMKNTDLGFQKEQKLVIPFKREADFKAFKEEFLKILGITGATACSGSCPPPGTGDIKTVHVRHFFESFQR